MSRAKKARKARPAKAVPDDRLIEGRVYERLQNGKLCIEGHQLNEEQERELIRTVHERMAIANRPKSGIQNAREYAHRIALTDLLFKHRPRNQAKDQLLWLGCGLSDAAHVISTMRAYSFHQSGAPVEHAAQLVSKLVGEAEKRVASLR
jgi:hypothetical protein